MTTPTFDIQEKCKFDIFSDGFLASIKHMSAESPTPGRVPAKGFIVLHMNTMKIAPSSVYSLPQEEKHRKMFFFMPVTSRLLIKESSWVNKTDGMLG